jgi:hypothetical protein
LAEVEAEADRDDPDWRLDALLAKRRDVPDKDNSALHVNATVALGAFVKIEGLTNYQLIFDNLTPSTQLNFQQEQLIRAELSKIPKAVDEARKLRDMPYGHFAVTISPDFISTRIPHHQNPRMVADWLKHDAYLLAHEEHTDLALESCQAIFNAGRTMGDDPFLIAHLIRISIQTMGVTATERVLAQGEATEETLEKLQGLLAKEIAESTWRHGMRGERAGSHLLFEGLRTGKVNLRLLRGLVGMRTAGPASDWLHDSFPSTLMKYYPEHLQFLNRSVEISKLPHHEQRKQLKDLEEKVQKSNNAVSMLFALPNKSVFEAECRSQAYLRATWVALACERYRLKHDRWPEKLNELVRAKLIDAIPLDPYDGLPLRYIRTKDGVTIYAIGQDGVDNQGNIHPKQAVEDGFDIGVRLWDTGLRRQMPPPAVVIPE